MIALDRLALVQLTTLFYKVKACQAFVTAIFVLYCYCTAVRYAGVTLPARLSVAAPMPSTSGGAHWVL